MRSRLRLLIAVRYHNYAQYLTDWTNALVEGNVSTDLKYRPPPVGTLYDNTTVNGSWIDVQDMTENSKNFKRMVNNVSLAMPHAGVFAAATDPKNRIIQPRDLDVSYIPLLWHHMLIALFRDLVNTTSKLRCHRLRSTCFVLL